jgi:hypothetical protein
MPATAIASHRAASKSSISTSTRQARTARNVKCFRGAASNHHRKRVPWRGSFCTPGGEAEAFIAIAAVLPGGAKSVKIEISQQH